MNGIKIVAVFCVVVLNMGSAQAAEGPSMTFGDVTAALRRSQKDEMVTLPKATAYDLLDEISRHIPPADKVKIDIDDLDIRAKKTSIKGTIDSAAAVDEIVAKLKEIECFEDISKGPITEVSGGAKQFSLAITSKCPCTPRPNSCSSPRLQFK